MTTSASPDTATRGDTPNLARGGGDDVRIVDLDGSLLPRAASIFAERFGRLREAVPELPRDLLDPAATEPLLRRAIDAGPAVAAMRGDELAGYMAGLAVPGLRGAGCASYVPEWAHGATGNDRAARYEAMYAAISGSWADAGRLCHCISILPGDAVLEAGLSWLGFGLFVVDALRGLAPIRASVPGVVVERATLADVDALVPLAVAHQAQYADAPTFLVRDEVEPRQQLRGWIESPGGSVWIARKDARPVAFMYLHPPQDDVSRLVRDPGTVGIGGAFTTPSARGLGIGRAILATMLDYARAAGFTRMAVDFETANLSARHFWLREFTPVVLSFERHLDDRVAGSRPGFGR
jgi:GNAT superfamily N-acetyltransferase